MRNRKYTRREKSTLYSDLPGDLVAPLPYAFENGLFFNFILTGDMRRLQTLCDQWFNRPSRFAVHVRPTMPIIGLTFVYYPKAWSRGLDLDEYGLMTYKEMIFSIFVEARTGFMSREKASYGFIPFLLLDHPRAISAGREAFGMPKAFGKIGFPEATGDGDNAFDCKAVAFENYGSKQSQSRELELVRLICPPDFDVKDYLNRTGSGLDALTEEFYREVDNDAGISLDMSRMLVRMNSSELINLVQFRDYQNGENALHQSIITYKSTKITMALGGVLGQQFELRFPDQSDMFPIKRALGLGPRVLGGTWYRMNFEFELGRQLWDAEKPRGFGLL